MAALKGSKTEENLKAAFAGESQANRRYLYFAKIARIEGFLDVATLFDELSEGGLQNAHGSLDYLTYVGDPATDLPFGETRRNLVAAIVAETYESTDLYPAMADKARHDGFTDIASWFETLAKVKAAHLVRLHQAAEQLRADEIGGAER